MRTSFSFLGRGSRHYSVFHNGMCIYTQLEKEVRMFFKVNSFTSCINQSTQWPEMEILQVEIDSQNQSRTGNQIEKEVTAPRIGNRMSFLVCLLTLWAAPSLCYSNRWTGNMALQQPAHLEVGEC